MASSFRPLLFLCLYTSIYLSVCVWLSASFTVLVPTPYMDEEFHIPQTQTYCAGRWTEWHPKITTLPGLYATAVPYAHAVGALTGADVTVPTELCSVTVLRSINILYGAMCIPLFYALLRTLHPSTRSISTLLSAIQLSLFPLSFFFVFLYYTDLASVFWTLAAYLAHLRGQRLAGALLGVAAVAMRQTNVAWVGFFLLTECLHSWRMGDAALFGKAHAERVRAADKLLQASRIDNSSAPRPFTNDGEKGDKLALESLHHYHTPSWFDIPRALFFLVRDCLLSLPALMLREWGPLLTCVAFVVFVVWNGGSIVVGDRDNHVFTSHFPQMLYFIAFTAGMTLWNWMGIRPIRGALENIVHHPIMSITMSAAMVLAVHKFTSGTTMRQTRKRKSRTAHPFLLSDNRHYPFYVWKNVFRRFDWAKYALVPTYLVLGAILQRQWTGPRAESRLFQLLFWLVTALCLVPTPLLEPRYFLTPFLLWFLHAAPRLTMSVPRSVLAICMFIVINAATIFIFLRKPFAWPNGSTARFMW